MMDLLVKHVPQTLPPTLSQVLEEDEDGGEGLDETRFTDVDSSMPDAGNIS